MSVSSANPINPPSVAPASLSRLTETSAHPAAEVTPRGPSPGAGRIAPAAKLQPKEHGAYAILGIPILTSLAITGMTGIGICVAVASIAGFLAHEPLLVVWGHRGQRAKRSTPAAKRRLVTFLAITLTAGLVAFAGAEWMIRIALLGCAALAMSSFVLASVGRHRTFGGELWGVAGLSVPCVPILLAGGLTLATSLAVWTAWLLSFGSTIFTVRGMIAAQKRRSLSVHLTGFFVLVSLTLGLVVSHHPVAIAALPMLALSGYLLWQPPPAKYLRRVGWTSLAGTIATAVWMWLLVAQIV